MKTWEEQGAELDLEQVDPPDGSGRYYLSKDGTRYDSVTTILAKTKVLSPEILNWQRVAESGDRKDRDALLEKWVKWKRCTREFAEAMKSADYSPRTCIILNWKVAGRISPELAERAILGQWSITRVVEAMGDAGAERGTALHEMIEAYAASDGMVEGSGPYWESISGLLHRIPKFKCNERRLKHEQLRYAGTLDAIGSWRALEGGSTITASGAVYCWDDDVIDDVLYDWKTSDRVKNIDWIRDYALQCSAYAAAARANGLAAIERACVAIAIPGRDAQEIWLGVEDLREAWREFQGRVAKFRALTKAAV